MRKCFTKVGCCLDTNLMHRLSQFVCFLTFCIIINFNFYFDIVIILFQNFHLTGTYGYSDFFDRAMGMLTPISHVPHMLLPYGDEMTYPQRVFNIILTLFDWLFRTWVTLPKQNEIAQRYFGHLAGMCCPYKICCC